MDNYSATAWISNSANQGSMSSPMITGLKQQMHSTNLQQPLQSSIAAAEAVAAQLRNQLNSQNQAYAHFQNQSSSIGYVSPPTHLGVSNNGGHVVPSQPIATQESVQHSKSKIFSGVVTKMHDSFGFVGNADGDVFFQHSVIEGEKPRVGDKVVVHASFNANMPFKWTADRLQLMTSSLTSLQHMTSVSNARQFHESQPGTLNERKSLLTSRKSSDPSLVAKQTFQAYTNLGPPNRNSFRGRSPSLTDGRANIPALISRREMELLKSRAARRSPERERPRKEWTRWKKESSRDSPPRKRVHEHDKTDHRSPSPKKSKPVAKYVIQVPKLPFECDALGVVELRKRYPNLYIPSDFFNVSFSWVDAFPLDRPLDIGKTSRFHIFDKEVHPITKQIDGKAEPSVKNHRWNVKVMLLQSCDWDDFFEKTCRLAHLPRDSNLKHPTRLINFLVGSRGKSEPLAIGGPWIPADGPDPGTNTQTLINTAKRTCSLVSGVDLTKCTKWCKFLEINYYRCKEDSKSGKRTNDIVETTVIFMPDVWWINPTKPEWDVLTRKYEKALNIRMGLEEEEEEEEEKEVTNAVVPTHFSQLDPRVMKVAELRTELELRSLSPKGIKNQLIARLQKAVKLEEETEDMDANKDDDSSPIKGDSEAKHDEDTKSSEELEQLRIVYKLPELPSILVHPSTAVKQGKFDCKVQSLSVLLDYCMEDNKEHSFEVYLFAEAFNEMLQRDFAYSIYKTLHLLNINDETKGDKLKENDKPKKESRIKKTKAEDDVNKSKASKEFITHNPKLLLAFSYYDQNHTGYLYDKDLEDIFYALDLRLSRNQIHKLVSKMSSGQKSGELDYRKLTDKEVDGKAMEMQADTKNCAWFGGNKQFLPLLPDKREVDNCGLKENSGLVSHNGVIVDINNLQAGLQRSDEGRRGAEDKCFAAEKLAVCLAGKLKSSESLETECRKQLKETQTKLNDVDLVKKQLEIQKKKSELKIDLCLKKLTDVTTVLDSLVVQTDTSGIVKQETDIDVKKEKSNF